MEFITQIFLNMDYVAIEDRVIFTATMLIFLHGVISLRAGLRDFD